MPEATAHVNLKVYTEKQQKVEVTIPLPFLVLRAEETSPDLYASIDLVVDKLERQIRKFKTKINRKSRGNSFSGSRQWRLIHNGYKTKKKPMEQN